MKKNKFPLLAVSIGLPLLLALMLLDESRLPLMTRLFMSEFGAILCGFGAYFGIRALKQKRLNLLSLAAVIVASLMAIKFALIGFQLWPG